MTLKSRKVLSAVHTAVIVLSLVSSPMAQTPKERLGIEPQHRQEPQQAEKEKKVTNELERKALVLIDKTVSEAMSLRLVENRVHILIAASDVLWARDESRARSLVRQAMDQSIAYVREAREKAAQEDGMYFDSRNHRHFDASYLRYKVLNALTSRDAKLAVEFLQLTRPLRQTGASRDAVEEQMDKKLELDLAYQIAGSDPQTALRIAEEHLTGKLDPQVVYIWNVLQGKDPKAASTLTGRIISELKSQDPPADYKAASFVFAVLNVLRWRADEIASARNNPDAANAKQVGSPAIQQAYREALEIVVTATLKITVDDLINHDEAIKARSLLMEVPKYLPDIEKLLPSRAPAVRAKVAQFDKAKYVNPHEKYYAEHGRDLAKKPIQEALALASKAPEDLRLNVYYQVANRAIDQGDDETARKIIRENLPDRSQANDLLAKIERRNSERAVSEGKYAEARKSLTRMGTDAQRASALVRWSSAAAGKGDEKSAREMLEEAGALIGSRMQRSDQLEAQMAIADAAINLDPDTSFKIAEAAIDRINRLIAASLELRTFDVVEEGEIMIMDVVSWGVYTRGASQLLTALARKDFDRAVNLLGRWQSKEIRLGMSLELVQNILGGDGVGFFEDAPKPQ